MFRNSGMSKLFQHKPVPDIFVFGFMFHGWKKISGGSHIIWSDDEKRSPFDGGNVFTAESRKATEWERKQRGCRRNEKAGTLWRQKRINRKYKSWQGPSRMTVNGSKKGVGALWGVGGAGNWKSTKLCLQHHQQQQQQQNFSSTLASTRQRWLQLFLYTLTDDCKGTRRFFFSGNRVPKIKLEPQFKNHPLLLARWTCFWHQNNHINSMSEKGRMESGNKFGKW